MAFLKLIAALMRFWLTPPLLDAPPFLSLSFEGFDSFLRISKFSRKKDYIAQRANNYKIKTFCPIFLNIVKTAEIKHVQFFETTQKKEEEILLILNFPYTVILDEWEKNGSIACKLRVTCAKVIHGRILRTFTAFSSCTREHTEFLLISSSDVLEVGKGKLTWHT